VPERVRALRRELKSAKAQRLSRARIATSIKDEFLPPSAERLRWLTGFTGSAGAAIVLENAAALFVDGRYTLQARAQTDIFAV
jgi:Xaa-Pro aminopeptidase